mgnify:CR=1 FL=1
MPSLFNPTHITRPLLPFKAVKVFGRCGSRDAGHAIHFGSGRGLRGGGGRPSSGSAALVGVTNCMFGASAVSRLSESAARVWRVRVAAVAAAFSAVRTRPQRVFVFQRTCLSSRGPSWSLAALQHS